MNTLIITIQVEKNRPDLLIEQLESLAKTIPAQIQDGNEWGEDWKLDTDTTS